MLTPVVYVRSLGFSVPPEVGSWSGGKGPGRRIRLKVPQRGFGLPEARSWGRSQVKSPTGAVGGSRRGQLASATDVAISGGDPAPDPEVGHGGGEDRGPEGTAGVAGGGRGSSQGVKC